MRVALMPAVPGDVKRAAEDMLIRKLDAITLGERSALARRGSGRIAAALLIGQPRRVLEIALQNPRMTEALVIAAMGQSAIRLPAAAKELAWAVAANEKWSHNSAVRRLLEIISPPDRKSVV